MVSWVGYPYDGVEYSVLGKPDLKYSYKVLDMDYFTRYKVQSPWLSFNMSGLFTRHVGFNATGFYRSAGHEQRQHFTAFG